MPWPSRKLLRRPAFEPLQGQARFSSVVNGYKVSLNRSDIVILQSFKRLKTAIYHDNVNIMYRIILWYLYDMRIMISVWYLYRIVDVTQLGIAGPCLRPQPSPNWPVAANESPEGSPFWLSWEMVKTPVWLGQRVGNYGKSCWYTPWISWYLTYHDISWDFVVLWDCWIDRSKNPSGLTGNNGPELNHKNLKSPDDTLPYVAVYNQDKGFAPLCCKTSGSAAKS